jgi:hypothetical protein
MPIFSVETRIAKLNKQQGYRETLYDTDQDLYKAIREGRYDGAWVLPPMELLDGVNRNNNAPVADNLHVHKETGAFSGTVAGRDPDNFFKGFYWTSTKVHAFILGTGLCGVRVDDAAIAASSRLIKDDDEFARMICRPVRLVPVARN